MLSKHISYGATAPDRSRLRDVIFLDLALESTARSYVEASMDAIKAASSAADLLMLWKVMSLMLESCCLSLGSNEELVLCLKDCAELSRILDVEGSTLGGATTMRLQAVLERLNSHLGERARHICNGLQPTAEGLGHRLGVDPQAVDIFSEEVVRSGPVAPISQLATALDGILRQLTGRGSWQVVSTGKGAMIGQVVTTAHLAEVQHLQYELPTILVAQQMGGEEEVPQGVVALITASNTDVLCHAAIRARNTGVILATCHDPGKMREISEAAGKWASLSAPPGGQVAISLGVEPAVAAAPSTAGNSQDAMGTTGLVESKQWCGKWALPSSEFHPSAVGAKALNLEAVRGRLPAWVGLPQSVAIPFGIFEEILKRNPAGVCARRVESMREVVERGDTNMLAALRLAVHVLEPQPEVHDALRDCFQIEGLQWNEESWPTMWKRITAVWGSQWNDRVVLAFRKEAALSHKQLSMSILCQPLLPAKYAFVAHTTNPLTGNTGEVYIEMVKGLGEALVGNYPGAALRATVQKPEGLLPADITSATVEELAGEVDVVGLPSKSDALLAASGGPPSLMFRSDSNCEDLPGLAGAGFFDSYPLVAPKQEPVDYTAEPLVVDELFRSQALRAVAAAAVAVEAVLGGEAQDIEGVLLEDGTLYVVQSRPQV